MPILYSFRRCPYAIRARLALYYSGVSCELREVVLKSKPSALIAVSPKATVPVLLLGEQQVIEQSIEIVDWALSQSDPDHWLANACNHPLIESCDDTFKYWLDRYKYADRFPEQTPEYYFQKACEFLQEIENELVVANPVMSALTQNDGKAISFCIASPNISVLDIAIFPFVRQFAFFDKAAFDALELPKLQAWLDYFLDSQLFSSVMSKYSMWIEGESPLLEFGQSVG